MAGNLLRHDDNLFANLGLPGKEFILPNISSSLLLEEFVVNPDVLDQIELEPCHTAILDDSCIFGVMSNPSISLVESVEAFSLRIIESVEAFSTAKPHVDVLTNKQENHGLRHVKVKNAEFHCPSAFFHSQIVRCDPNASAVELQTSSNNPQPSINQLLEEVIEKLRNCFVK